VAERGSDPEGLAGWRRALSSSIVSSRCAVERHQYLQLGISRFSELYVRGFLSGGSYEAVPAFSLSVHGFYHARAVLWLGLDNAESLYRALAASP